MLFSLVPALSADAPEDVFTLRDYRWVDVTVRRAPTLVRCTFAVQDPGGQVKAELLTDRDFRAFARRMEYETLAESDQASSGGFNRVIERPGRYRLVLFNASAPHPVQVSFSVNTEVDPDLSSLSTGVPDRRKYTVILASLTAFAALVFWSGRRIVAGWRKRPNL